MFESHVSTPLNVPEVLQLHGLQPSGLFAVRLEYPGLHTSHFRPMTLALQAHCPKICPPLPSSLMQSPWSVMPLGSHLQGSHGSASEVLGLKNPN